MTGFSPSVWPHWALMWSTAVAIYASCKCLTWQTAATQAPFWKHAAYLLGWPGMDASSFLGARSVSGCLACRSSEWFAALGKLMSGLALLFAVAPTIPPQHAYVVGWTGMIGAVLVLHFGLFHLLSCLWRSAGLRAHPLMNRPWAAASVGDFWGRRWNTAFRDLTHRLLFRRCASWFGTRWGIAAAFLFSGAIHDLVISVPARGGYGGPTAFFAIQGLAMLFERSRLGARIGLGAGWPGRMFAAAVLLAPIGLLFHRPFVVGVIVPFMRVLGAI
jgi:alginate O-acetyltransferase complex protein AlgI